MKASNDTANAVPRPIWLCADDYGISPAVSKGIRELVVRGRLNATSVMVLAPTFDAAEAASLKTLNADGRRVAIGLHVTLTAPFKAMSANFRPTRGGAFFPLWQMFVWGFLRLLDRKRLVNEIEAQLAAFESAFGAPPDFLDGHQHVHLFPVVREALLDVAKARAPHAWVRQCGRVEALQRRSTDFKTWVLDTLSGRFKALAEVRGVRTNPAFAGAYDFASPVKSDFARLFPGFLELMPADGVVMCHPGFVDAELERLDPLTTQREREYAYLGGDELPAALCAHGLALA